jgi:adenylosuccinate synthase
VSATVLIGTQWGDEGKGKITDLICADYDYCVRYQGGNNAGHTVIANGHELALHLVPSGVMYEQVTPVIGNGCVIDPKVLLEEIDKLEAEGISCARLKISAHAHMIMPYHVALDHAAEDNRAHKVGTTGRGIGPCYQDKAARIGLRMENLLDLERFEAHLKAVLPGKKCLLSEFYGQPTLDGDRILADYSGYAARLRDKICDTGLLLNLALDAGKQVLLEGAQGTQLDLDHGTYPYVTSSSCSAGGATVGSGIGPTRIDRVLGIAKAYLTRVGEGPFPTELDDEDGATLGSAGAEVGVTTGRARRCGWYDAPVVKYAAQVNGLTELALTKLDVLSAFAEIKVCVDYQDGRPVYETLPGWQTDITGCRSFEELPMAAQAYVKRLEELAGVPVTIVAVGPDRAQTILR